MYEPKLIIKVKLFKDNKVKFKTVYVNESISKDIDSVYNGNMIILTPNDWAISISDSFKFYPLAKCLSLPKNTENTEEIMISFSSDEERENTLRNLYTTLILWSDDPLFKLGEFDFDDDSSIVFNDDTWLIF